jgi:hypothetical protein
MFAKLAAVIVSMGVIACVLLAVRQQRVQAAHEMADVQRRVMEHDRTLWHLRAEIAARVTPERIDKASAKLGPTAPIGPERYHEMVRRETEASQVASAD